MKTAKPLPIKYTKDYVLLIDEEAEIKVNDLCLIDHNVGISTGYEILVCEEVEKDGWYHFTDFKTGRCSKIIAYHPLNSETEELDLPLLPNPFEENIEILWSDFNKNHNRNCPLSKEQFVRAINYKATQSKQFSLEDMKKAFEAGEARWGTDGLIDSEPSFGEFIQSLSTQKLPSEFIPEYDEIIVDKLVPKMPIDTIKTITNSEGKEELVGVYRY